MALSYRIGGRFQRRMEVTIAAVPHAAIVALGYPLCAPVPAHPIERRLEDIHLRPTLPDLLATRNLVSTGEARACARDRRAVERATSFRDGQAPHATSALHWGRQVSSSRATRDWTTPSPSLGCSSGSHAARHCPERDGSRVHQPERGRARRATLDPQPLERRPNPLLTLWERLHPGSPLPELRHPPGVWRSGRVDIGSTQASRERGGFDPTAQQVGVAVAEDPRRGARVARGVWSSCRSPSPPAPRRSSTGRRHGGTSIGRANLDGTGVERKFLNGTRSVLWHRRRRCPHLLADR